VKSQKFFRVFAGKIIVCVVDSSILSESAFKACLQFRLVKFVDEITIFNLEKFEHREKICG